MPSTAVQPVNLELERAELQSVLGSPTFARCPTLAHLLSYLCEKTFAGETAQIKEYSVALEIEPAPETFKPKLGRRTWLVFAGAIALAILAVIGLGLHKREKPRPPVASSQNLQALIDAPAGLPVGDEVRILAGASRSYV